MSRSTTDECVKGLKDAGFIEVFQNSSKYDGNLFVITHKQTLDALDNFGLKNVGLYRDNLDKILEMHRTLKPAVDPNKKEKTIQTNFIKKLNENKNEWVEYANFKALTSSMMDNRRQWIHALCLTYHKLYPVMGYLPIDAHILRYAIQLLPNSESTFNYELLRRFAASVQHSGQLIPNFAKVFRDFVMNYTNPIAQLDYAGYMKSANL